MNVYPQSIPILTDSSLEVVDPTLVSRSRSGDLKIRRLQVAKKLVFKVAHKNISASDKSTLENFYDANRLLPFEFYWPGVGSPYTAVFLDDKGFSWKPEPGALWSVNFTIAQV